MHKDSVKLSVVSKDEDPQAKVEQALIEYCSFRHNQGFAIMLNGAWGSGKTRFIKDLAPKLLRERPGETRSTPLYVSLYGVGSTSEIDTLLFQQMHPILGGKATRLVAAFVSSAAKLAIPINLGGGAQINTTLQGVDISSILAGASGRVVIFDDFERAILPPAAILGYINPLVEHEDSKVIIIADEENIRGDAKTDYDRLKEKTIGQTFEFFPAVSLIFDSFVSDIEDVGAQTCLRRWKFDLLQVFADSGLQNLRLLKQLAWDIERLWSTLTKQQQEHDGFAKQLLCLLCAAALELRSGRIKEVQFYLDLNRISLRHLSKNRDGQTADPMEEILGRYPTIRFDDGSLDAQTICDCVLRSKVSKQRVQQQLLQHPYFAKREESDSWRTLWLSHEAPAGEQDKIVSQFEDDFDQRKFDTKGAVRHVIGLGLWLAALGYPKWSEATVEEKLRSYISDVFASRDPTLEDAIENDLEDFSESSDGLGYKRREDQRFSRLSRFEREQRSIWKKKAYPAIASLLQDLARVDSERFLREVCFTEGGPAKYARIGVLQLIPAKDFAELIASLPYDSQTKIAIALSLRYEQAFSYEELHKELGWLREVNREATAAASTLPLIAKGALLNLLRRYVDGAVDKLEHHATVSQAARPHK